MLKDDDQMLLKVRKPQHPNKQMLEELKQYFKKKGCAYYAKLVVITILDKETQTPLEAEHYCVIVKPKNKYNIDKHNYEIFQIMNPYLPDDADFVDFSILGHLKTMQIYENENYVEIFS